MIRQRRGSQLAAHPTDSATSPSLIRSIGIFQLTLYGLGSMLGSGIYALIGQAAGQVGNAVWASSWSPWSRPCSPH